ncbi:major facilitator superfamily domain-containing protein [Xylaria nigripes]|nr:major facilitator superfamily domain-containing protein [Xylaria nigripes]
MATSPLRTSTDVSSHDDVHGTETSSTQLASHEVEQEKKEPLPAEEGPKEGDILNDHLTGFKLFALLFSTALIFFALLLDTSIISTAVPKITSEFHSLPDVGWYTGAYQLASAVLQPLTGKLYTFFPTKWTFLIFFCIFEVGSLLCAVATSSTFFIIGRAVAGLGVSGLQNGSLTIVSSAVALQERAFYLGLLIGAGQIGLVIGPLVGGLLTEYVTWRWCFYLNLPLGAVAGGLLAIIHCPEQIVKPPFSLSLFRRVIPQLDIIGFLLFAPAAIMLLLALQLGSGDQHAWNSSVVIGLFVGAGVAVALFLLWEWKAGEKAIIPFSMIGNRIVWTSTVQYVALVCAVFVGTQYLPIFFQAVLGVGPVLSGVYLLPGIITQLILVIVTGSLIPRVGYYLPFAVLAGIGATLGAGLISTWGPHTTIGMWIGFQIIWGFRGAGVQLAIVAIQNALPGKLSQLGVSFLVFAQTFSTAVFVVIGNTIFTQSLLQETSRLVPSVDATKVLQAGGSAQAVRSLVPPGSPELAALLRAYSNAFSSTCYLMVAAAGISVIASFGMGWVDIRKTKQEANAEPMVEV